RAWKVFDDAFPTLDRLATHGLKLGVISNWDERLRPLLAELKLSEYFQAIVVYNEVGFPKPSPVIFEVAAEELGLAPNTILHVGDNAARDLDGARSAGFHGFWLKRRGAIERADQIRSLSEINLPIEA